MKRLGDPVEELTEQVEEYTEKPVEREKPIDLTKLVSTGSTLLDLSISGNRVYGGGLPGGIIVEFSGPPSSGKTAVMVEIAASAQVRGGQVRFDDPEGRLDTEYAELFGLSLKDEKKDSYHRSDTVEECLKRIREWKVDDNLINVNVADSLAALTTKEELEGTDKYGAKRAKDFSEGLRMLCREISHDNRLVAFTNQLRDNFNQTGFGPKQSTPGGNAIPFYSSVRVRLTPGFPKSKVERERTITEQEKDKAGKVIKTLRKLSKVVGVISKAVVFKNSVDDPYREADIYIMFGYGIDDIRGNLEYIKFITGESGYRTRDSKKLIGGVDHAITTIESEEAQDWLRKKTIDLWYEVEKKFQVERQPKIRI